MAAPQASNQQQQIQLNQIMRNLLIQSSPQYIKNLGAFNSTATGTAALGTTTRVKLFNVGITTKLVIDIVTQVDIGTATATASPKAPYNLIDRIKLTDFDGTDRINCSGYQAWVWNSCRRRTPYGLNNESQTAVLTSPVLPTAVATGQTLRFQLEIPLAYNPEQNSALGPNVDLRGALLTQTNVGECYLNLTWNSTLYGNANDNAVYHGAGTTTAIITAGQYITANITQHYLMPTSVPFNGNMVTPIPMLDLLSVYEFTSFLSTDNLAAAQEKLINYPNVRNVVAMYVNFINNGVLNPATTDITKVRLLVNGNNTIREYTATEKLFAQRMDMAACADLRPGTYWEQHRVFPIATSQYGNVQLGITPSTVSGANTGLEVGVEAFYIKNATLPGISQSA